MLIDIYMKFGGDSGHDFVTESKGNISKRVNARFIVFALCTSSNGD